MQDKQIKTKRLTMIPMTIEELDRMVLLMRDEDDRDAYNQMLTACRRAPDTAIWNAPWKIVLNSGNTMVGDIGFKGPPVKGAVEIGYQIDAHYRDRGYMTEAARALIEWAFLQPDLYIIEAQANPQNAASIRVLEKLGFRRIGKGLEGDRYRKDKPETNLVPVYMILGLSIGAALGLVLGSLVLGMLLGVAGGYFLGSSLDSGERKHRREITGL